MRSTPGKGSVDRAAALALDQRETAARDAHDDQIRAARRSSTCCFSPRSAAPAARRQSSGRQPPPAPRRPPCRARRPSRGAAASGAAARRCRRARARGSRACGRGRGPARRSARASRRRARRRAARAGPAVRLGDREAREPELGHAAPERRVEGLLRVEARAQPGGVVLLGEELRDRVLEQPLLVREPEVHAPCSYLPSAARSSRAAGRARARRSRCAACWRCRRRSRRRATT